MSTRTFRHQKFTIPVAGAGNYPLQEVIDQTFKNVIAIAVQATNPAGLVGSTFSQPLSIGGEIVFDGGYEAKMLYAGQEVAPKEKFMFFDKPYKAEGNQLVSQYTDTSGLTYGVTIYLWLTNDLIIKQA